VQADWAAIGIKAKLVQNEAQIAFTAYRARDFQIGSMSWYADYNDAMTFLAIMKSDTGAQNYGDYNNPEYDALLVASDIEADAARRAAILAKAEQIMLDDEGLIPMFFVVNRALVSPKITGWVDNVSRIHPTRFLCVK
jgi:oligopeptide transport system substrate-binding protein